MAFMKHALRRPFDIPTAPTTKDIDARNRKNFSLDSGYYIYIGRKS